MPISRSRVSPISRETLDAAVTLVKLWPAGIALNRETCQILTTQIRPKSKQNRKDKPCK
jgi:hypothetical protein